MKKSFYFITLIAIVATVLTSCKKDEKDKNKDVFTVSGIIPSNYGAWSEVKLSYDFGNTWVATSQISNWKFSIKPPTPESKNLEPVKDLIINYLLDMVKMPEIINIREIFNQSNAVNISDAGTKGTIAMFYVFENDEKKLLSLVSIPSVFQYLYADKKVDLTGVFEEIIEEVAVKLTFDLKLNEGWNTMIVSMTPSLSKQITMSFKTGTVPAVSAWVVAENPFNAE